MTPAKNRQEATDLFWEDVKNLLTGEHQRDSQQAQRGIVVYKNEVKRRKLGEVVFNQGEEHIAKVIDGLIGNKFQFPKPTKSQARNP